MNKSELIANVANAAAIPKKVAEKAVKEVFESIEHSLADGETVTLVGFGTFSTKQREARTGRNPRTGESIKIKAAIVPVFKAGKALKDAVNM